MSWVHYAREVDPTDVNNAHTLAGLMVPSGTRVLDVGTGTGAVAEFLASRGCQVWGIEADAEAAAQAERWCVRVLTADVETLDLDRAFDGQRFGAILCLDVLEHLKAPLGTLCRIVRRLEPGGQVLISLPNVTHASVRLQMAHGRFPRTDAGLLDRTHLQFFDRTAALSLIHGAGLRVSQELRVVKRPDETEIPYELGGLTHELIEAATDGPDATTYQFVFAAVVQEFSAAAEAPSLATVLQQRLNEAIERQAATTRWAELLEQQHVQWQTELADLAQAVGRATRERDDARREAQAARDEASGEAAARARAESKIDHLVERIETAVVSAHDLTALREQVARAERERATAETELAYERRVAQDNVRRHEQLDSRTHDLTVALVARSQQLTEVEQQLDEARALHARLRREVAFLQNDRIVKDAFVAELRQRLLDATTSGADARATALARDVEDAQRRLAALAAEHGASQEAAAQATARLQALEEQLAQPRYALVDRLNARLKRLSPLHRILKACVPAARRAPRS